MKGFSSSGSYDFEQLSYCNSAHSCNGKRWPRLPTNEQKEKPTQSTKSLSNWSGGSQYSPVERITAAIVPNDDGTSNQPQNIDEIKQYIDCRYVSPSEASWRIFSFPIHGRKPAVERLYFHCEGQNSVYYTDFDRINTVLEKPSVTESMFTSWFEANCKYPEAQNLTYSKFVSKFVYVKKKREWKPRQKGYTNGRLIWVPPTTDELYYLRLMLTHVKGPRSYNDIKTVNNVKYDTFRDACFAMGFIGDDREFIAAIKEENH
ncbi:hypothetical protein KIW84_030546 [Lathyrus oleraceus]|uniref:Uncharacterized protein n=1 Tax=Pisum sativum TaxID=3888 RepID=A0A9D4XTE5_PEA|nr:hypothetical protein KIW84_030546 [Pisum sativum]